MTDQHEKRARTVKIIVGICFAFIVIAYMPLAYTRVRSLVQSLGDSTVNVEQGAQRLWKGDVEEKLKSAASMTKEQWLLLQEYQATAQQISEFADEVRRAADEQVTGATSTESFGANNSEQEEDRVTQ
ncbi:hypothetical protein HYV71_02890 [Candidatus Uhrbacteria bacterium]|nr:hypothetical protein [Candidatus Uhrbacteria bacterium]